MRRQRPAGLADGGLDQAAHAQDRVADQLLLAVERFAVARRRAARRRRLTAASLTSRSIGASMLVRLPAVLVGHRLVGPAQPNRPDT